MTDPRNVDGTLPTRSFRSMGRKTAAFMKFLNQIGGDRQPEAHVQSHETEMRRAQDWRTEIQSLAKGIRALVELLDGLGLMDLAWEAEFKGTATSIGQDPVAGLHDWYTSVNSSVSRLEETVDQLEAFLRVDHPTLHLLADLIYQVKYDLTASIAAVAAAAVSDHGALTGLADNDHPQYIQSSIVDAKGDLIVATAADTVARLAVGSNKRGLVADSGAAGGVDWGGAIDDYMFANASTFDHRYDGAHAMVALTTLDLTVDLLYAYPVWIKRPCTIDRIGYEVTTGGAAGSKVRLGIYKANASTDPKPGDLLADSGEFSGAAVESTGMKEKTVSISVLEPGLHWFALVCNSTATALIVRAIAAGATLPLLGMTSSGNNRVNGVTRTFTYGALPDPFAGSLTARAGVMPQVYVRFSAAT